MGVEGCGAGEKEGKPEGKGFDLKVYRIRTRLKIFIWKCEVG